MEIHISKILWAAEQETAVFLSLITFPTCCNHWREAHKFDMSQLYRRHINVEAHCCLISSSLRIRKWKCAAEKRANLLEL